MKHQLLLLPIALAVSQAWADTDPVPEETVILSPVTVTGTQQQKANRVTFNPKAALQPLPAGDGADLLQSVPNMSIIRKGGSSGDPLFRGLGGSRLSVNADDQFIYGGCGMRMDPPTAYIHPNSFDKVVVTKGPQTVTQGMGLVSGSVQFIRKDPDFTEKPSSAANTATSAAIFPITEPTITKTATATAFTPTSNATAKCCNWASPRPKTPPLPAHTSAAGPRLPTPTA